jgi:hypothetical protein
MRLHAIIAAVGLAALGVPAQAFTAINGLAVNPVQGGFEVVSYGGDGPRQIWCAAGEYARAVHGVSGSQRIYISDGYGPSKTVRGKRGVSFTLAGTNGPRPGTNGNYSVSMRTPGFNLAAAHAESFCDDVFDVDPWPF